MLLAVASVSGANSFTADGTVFEPTHGYMLRSDRYLVPDGDFEQGTCISTPTWTCTSDNTCDWIADLVRLGLWNYNGSHIAWLGGFCGGLATCSTMICRVIAIDTDYECVMSWAWMAYVNDAVMQFFVTLNGDLVYEFYPQLSDHLLDYQIESIVLPVGIHPQAELCFGMSNPQCAANLGDNYFADYVEVYGLTATQEACFSAVKALY